MVEPASRLFQGTLMRAYRRTWSAGLEEVGTDLVLNCVALHVAASDGWLLKPLLENVGWRGETAQTDPPPPVPRWQDRFGQEVAFEAAVVLGEAANLGGQDHRRRFRCKPVPAAPVFSPAVRYVVHDAIAEAADDEYGHAEPHHLIAALLRLGGPAAESLTRWVPDEELRRIELGEDMRRNPNGRSQWAIGALAFFGVLPPILPKPLRGPARLAGRWLGRQYRRPYRSHGARYGHPLLQPIEDNALSQAMQTGHGTVTAAHVLLSMIELHRQLDSGGRPLPAKVARWSQGGPILAAHGVSPGPEVWAAAVRLEPVPGDAEHDLDDLPSEGWPPPRPMPAGVPVQGRTALSALRQASLSAYRLGHPYAGTTHLLAELLADPAGPAARLLRRLGVDPAVPLSEAVQRLEDPLPAVPDEQG